VATREFATLPDEPRLASCSTRRLVCITDSNGRQKETKKAYNGLQRIMKSGVTDLLKPLFFSFVAPKTSQQQITHSSRHAFNGSLPPQAVISALRAKFRLDENCSITCGMVSSAVVVTLASQLKPKRSERTPLRSPPQLQ
jgi:hypothetical protein